MFPPEAFRNTLLKFGAIADSLKLPFHLTGGIDLDQSRQSQESTGPASHRSRSQYNRCRKTTRTRN